MLINLRTKHYARHVAFALYTKCIRLARFGCGFMISCKFEILVWSNSSLPVDSTDAASLEVTKIKTKQGNWEIWKFGSIYTA